MSAARQQAIAAIDTQLLNRQSQQAIYGPGVEDIETVGPVTKQQATLTAPTSIDPGEPTIKLPGAFKYQPGNAPPPPKETQNRAQQEATIAQKTRARTLRLYDQTQRTITNLGTNTKRSLFDTNRFLGNIPSPGGIWVPFWILIFLFMVLIPVGGHTRIKWLWLVITNHARISGESAILGGSINPQPSSGSGSSGGGIWGGALGGGILSVLSTPTQTPVYSPPPQTPIPTYTSTGGLVEMSNAGDYFQIPGNNYIVSMNGTGEGY